MFGKYLRPYLIAEIGVNHGGDIKKAFDMIDQIAEMGWHCAKFQTYKADRLASKNSPAYWDTKKEATKSQHELFKKYDNFNSEDYIKLEEHCRLRGVDFLTTAFDEMAVEELDTILPFYKVASADLTNIPLLRRIASKRKPVILSTGASELYEIERAIGELKANGAKSISLLHCVLNYPTPPENANLLAIEMLKKRFAECEIGYSDHVAPDDTCSALIYAIILGATIIEKHFTYDRTLSGNDHYHAFDMEIGKAFQQKLSDISKMFGNGEVSSKNQASAVINARRSVVANKLIKSGEMLTEENLTVKRPGTGISSVYWDEVIGKKANRDISEDEIIGWGSLDE